MTAGSDRERKVDFVGAKAAFFCGASILTYLRRTGIVWADWAEKAATA